MVSQEIKEIKKNFSGKTPLGKRRTKINFDTKILNFDLNFNEPSEPITILLSRQGWIKTLKGHGHNINDIKFKDGDEFLIHIEVISDGKSLIFSSNGKFYTVENNQLPSGRGYGDPLSSIIDLQDGDNIVSLHPYDQNFEVLIASKKVTGL